MLSPHPASFPGRGLCFRVLSCFPPLDFPGSCPSPDFRVSVPSFPTSLSRFFPASAFGLSRFLSSPDFRVPVPSFPTFLSRFFPASAFGLSQLLSSPDFRVPVPSFPTSLFRFFRLPPPGISGFCPALFLPSPGFSGTRLPSGYSQPFSGIVFSGPASGFGLFRRFFRNTHNSGTPAARVSHITTPRASVTPST